MSGKKSINLIFLIVAIFIIQISCDDNNDVLPPSSNYAPVKPENPTPTQGSINVRIDPTLRWICSDPEGDQMTYDVYLGKNSPPPVVSSNQNETYYSPGTLEYDTQYYWKIVAKDGSGNITNSDIWEFKTMIYIPIPAPPTLYTPSDGSTSDDNTPDFDWNDPSDAYKYELLVDVNSNFNSPLIAQSDLSTSNYTPSASLVEGTYYWRVRARNYVGTWGNWSDSWSFTIDIPEPVPDPPILFVPIDGSTTTDNTPLFDWSEPKYAYQYELEVDNSIDFSSPEFDLDMIGSSVYELFSPINNDTYYWRVRAKNLVGTWGNWSEIRSFTIEAP